MDYCLTRPEQGAGALEDLALKFIPAQEVGAPRIEGCVGYFECRVEDRMDVGDATIFKGKPVTQVQPQRKDEVKRLYLMGENADGKRLFKAFPAEQSFPERLAMIVSGDANGEHNAMVVGWTTVVSRDPVVVAAWIGKTRHSYGLVRQHNEFVYVVPGDDMKGEVSFYGTRSGRDVDKFKELSLETLPPRVVKAPLLKKALANYECKIIGEMDWGSHTIFVGEAKAACITNREARRLFYLGGDWKNLDSYGSLQMKE